MVYCDVLFPLFTRPPVESAKGTIPRPVSRKKTTIFCRKVVWVKAVSRLTSVAILFWVCTRARAKEREKDAGWSHFSCLVTRLNDVNEAKVADVPTKRQCSQANVHVQVPHVSCLAWNTLVRPDGTFCRQKIAISGSAAHIYRFVDCRAAPLIQFWC